MIAGRATAALPAPSARRRATRAPRCRRRPAPNGSPLAAASGLRPARGRRATRRNGPPPRSPAGRAAARRRPPRPGDEDPLTSPSFSRGAQPGEDSRSYGSGSRPGQRPAAGTGSHSSRSYPRSPGGYPATPDGYQAPAAAGGPEFPAEPRRGTDGGTRTRSRRARSQPGRAASGRPRVPAPGRGPRFLGRRPAPAGRGDVTADRCGQPVRQLRGQRASRPRSRPGRGAAVPGRAAGRPRRPRPRMARPRVTRRPPTRPLRDDRPWLSGRGPAAAGGGRHLVPSPHPGGSAAAAGVGPSTGVPLSAGSGRLRRSRRLREPARSSGPTRQLPRRAGRQRPVPGRLPYRSLWP